MSIVKMQKISVIGLEERKRELLDRLIDLEAVELRDQTYKLSDDLWKDNVSSDTVQEKVAYFEGKVTRAQQAMDVIEEYGRLKKPLFKTRRIISEEYAHSIPSSKGIAEELIERLIGLNDKLRQERDEINRIDVDNLMLEPWQDFDVPLDQLETRDTAVLMGALPTVFDPASLEQTVSEVTDRYVMKQVNEDKARRFLAMILPKEEVEDLVPILKDQGLQPLEIKDRSGTVRENMEKNLARRDELLQEREDVLTEIAAIAAQKDVIEEYSDLMTVELDKRRARSKLLKTDKTFFLEGWVPDRKENSVKALLDELGCVYEFEEPSEEDAPPVLLKNPGFFTPLEAITEMYSLPAYGTFDPTSIFALWYIVFFGMMFSDACYGLIMMVVLGIVLKKYNLEGTMKKMVTMLFYCGISTFVFGALFGGWFGNAIEVIAETFFGKTIDIKPLWFDPLDDPLTLLLISLVLGVAHLFLALGIEAYNLLKEGKVTDFVCDVLLWYVTIIGLIMWLGGGMVSEFLTPVGKWMSIIGIAGLLLTGGRDRKGIGKLVGGFSNVYNITSWLSDILSYARVLALGLATGAIAQVVNTMGALGGKSIGGVILFVLVFIFGHLLNFAINALGAFIHSARLQFVEFFGKFFVDGGEPFDPFRMKTKYVKVDNTAINS
ncbi:MAG: V-type ATP synthase subunit I [Firmicutes bacterium]|nr:V-type ATP synthase subunit I [Bacillota bacterium]